MLLSLLSLLLYLTDHLSADWIGDLGDGWIDVRLRMFHFWRWGGGEGRMNDSMGEAINPLVSYSYCSLWKLVPCPMSMYCTCTSMCMPEPKKES